MAAAAARRRVSASEVTTALRQAIERRPISVRGEPLTLQSASQVSVGPPTFALRVNRPDEVHFSYERYLMRSLRLAFGFEGSPTPTFAAAGHRSPPAPAAEGPALTRRRALSRRGLAVVVLAVLLLVAGALVLATPRHRASYVGQVTTTAGPGARPVRDAVPLPTPLAGAPSASPASPAAAPAGRPQGPPTRPTGSTATGVSLPAPDASGRVRVPISDRTPGNVPAGGVPTGWELKEFTGESSVELVRAEGTLALRLRSDKSSFALHRDVVLDVRRYPILTWTWKVARLPSGGDVRDPQRDDQAAQVYVLFPRWPSPRTTSDVIGYVWDSRAPVGTTLVHPRAPNVRIVVVESGPSRLGTWVREQRNVAADFRALFGRRAPPAGQGRRHDRQQRHPGGRRGPVRGPDSSGPAGLRSTYGNPNHHAKMTRMTNPSATPRRR